MIFKYFIARARKLSFRLVVFDTTHDTNACGLYLALFVVMNKYGMCETVGKTLIARQDAFDLAGYLKHGRICFN